MAVAVARVPASAVVSWIILHVVMRSESEEVIPELERLTTEIRALCDTTTEVLQHMESLFLKLPPLLAEVENLQKDLVPVWDDSYNLCGNPECFGDCRVCQEGEEDYEEDYTEKYCRRGRR